MLLVEFCACVVIVASPKAATPMSIFSVLFFMGLIGGLVCLSSKTFVKQPQARANDAESHKTHQPGGHQPQNLS
jgi:hypothetical protein